MNTRPPSLNFLALIASILWFAANESYLVAVEPPPTQTWTALYNGTANGTDQANAAVLDSTGNVYVTGQSAGSGSGSDYATIKYNPVNGAGIWTNRYNGTGNSTDEATAITTDALDNIYVTGHSTGSSGGFDYVTIKYTSSGTPVWTNRFNGTGNAEDDAYAIKATTNGVYLTGRSMNGSANFDIVTLKINPTNGATIWTNIYNGAQNGLDEGNALFLDASESVFVTGGSTGVAPGGGASPMDAVTIKINPANGAGVWTNRFNAGNDFDEAKDLTVDTASNVVVVIQSTVNNNSIYEIVRYDNNGNVSYSTNETFNGKCFPAHVFNQPDGNVLVTGATQNGNNGLFDFEVFKITTTGAVAWTQTFSSHGGGSPSPNAVANTDPRGNIYLAGQYKQNGRVNYEIAKFLTDGTAEWTTDYNNANSNDSNPYALVIGPDCGIYITGISGNDFATVQFQNGLQPYLTTVSTLTNAFEDNAFTISYDTLFNASDALDNNACATLCFRLIAVSTGTLTKGGSTAIPGTTSLCSGESWVWTAATNANGILNAFTVELYDSATNTTTPIQVTVNVTAVNDQPTFTLRTNSVTSLEDAGSQTVLNLATNMNTGPSDESAQTWTFIVTNNNNSLFSVQPAISTNGALTYTAAANSNGTATVTIYMQDSGGTANGGVNTSIAQTLTINITPVNDPPTFSFQSTNVTVLEDAGPQSASFVTLSPGPPNEASQTITFTVSNNNSNLFAVQPSISSSGVLTFTTTANSNGVATITVLARDDGGSSNGGSDSASAQTFTITVTPVNDPPTLNSISNVTINEDASQQTVNLSGITVGPPNETGQILTVTASSSDTGLIPNPTVTYTSANSTGSLAFTPVANSNGVATITVVVSDNGGTANGGVNSVTNTFTVTVNSINDPPTISSISNVTINEDAAQQTINLSGITPGPLPNESWQTVIITATSSDPGLIPNPTVNYSNPATTGTLTFTPVANSNGVATITVVTTDSGGTTNGGINAVTNTFTVTVNSVNDRPTLTTIPNQTVLEDASTQTINLSGITPGPLPNESWQTVSFSVSSSNTNLVPTPTIGYTNSNTTGTLTYTPVANANGTATITVILTDTGGTTNGGINATTNTFTITVTGVNDPPTINAITDRTINEDVGLQTISLSGITSGPANESAQTISVTATSSDPNLVPNPAITYTSPNTTGSLSFTPVANSNGMVTITVVVSDNGGTANGGVDSVTNTFTVTINSVNDAPSFVKGADIAVNRNSGAQSLDAWATSISAGPLNESSQSVNFIVSNNSSNLFSIQPSISPDGTLTFTPAGNVSGTATVTVQIHDNGGTANGGSDTSTAQTFVIRINTASVTPATGGEAISADRVNGTFTALSGPVYREGGSADADVGTIILNAPAGFEFDTAGVAPTVLVTRTSGSGADANNINGVASGTSLLVTSVTSSQIVFTVTSPSTNGVTDSLTWQNIRVRPTEGDLPAGIITSSGTAGLNEIVQGVTSWGALGEIPGSPAQLVFHTEPSSTASAGVTFAQQPVIWVTDQFGNHITYDNSTVVTLSRDSASGTDALQGTLTGTASAGVVAFAGIYYRTAETIQIDATATGLATGISTPITISAAGASKLVIRTQPSPVVDAGVVFPVQPVVAVEDQFGNIITSDNTSVITVSRTTTTGTGTLYGTLPIQVVNGVATFTNLSYQVAETIRLDFNSGNFVTVTSDNIRVVAGAPDRLVFVQQPFVETAGIIFSTPPIIKVTDAYGNVPTGLPTNLDVTISLYAGSGVLSGTKVLNIGTDGGNGTVTYSDLQINAAGENKQLEVTASDVAEAISAPFVVISTVQPYNPILSASAGLGPIGARLGNLRGLQFSGSTSGSGPRWRDMIVANYNANSVMVRLCRDDGTFGSPTFYPVGLHPFAVNSGDFKRDGDEDIVVSNFGTNTVSVLLNRGNGTFGAAVNYIVGSTPNPGPIHIELADVIGDASHDENSPFPRPDIITANYNENTISILHGIGAGKFAAPINYSVGSHPACVVARDLNKDGLIDLITANSGDGTLTILYGVNKTNGMFRTGTNITLFPGGDPQPIYVATHDFNGDGIWDIATANYNSNTVSILLGQADGSFVMFTNYTTGTHPRSLLVRDVNHDSKPDVVVANSGSATLDVFLNVGDGSFVSGGILPVGNNPMVVVGSNFNNDGGTDMVVANYGDNTVSILLYNGPLVYPKSVTTFEDTPVSFTINASILDGTALSYELLTQPEHGTLTGTPPNLTYTPETNYYGTDTFKYRAFNATLSSAPATVTLTIRPVDDPPSFTLASNVVNVTSFGTLQSITNFARNISSGPANESVQALAFVLTVTNRSFFTTAPVISTNGTLTFKPALSASGTNYIIVRLKDSSKAGVSDGVYSTAQIFAIVLNNPFPALKKGSYNGLFYEAESVSHYRSGFFTFQLTDTGTFSGRVSIAGSTYSCGGAFDLNGNAAPIRISRGTNTPLIVTYVLDVVNNTDQVSGTVTDGHWIAFLSGDRAVYTGTTLAPQFGRYTLSVPGVSDSPSQPGGTGYGAISVSKAGLISLSGQLGDSTPVSQSVPVSKNGQWPLYVSLYSGKGSILSWITFSNSTLGGSLSWVKTPVSGKYYPAGFTNETDAVGSSYVPPASGNRILSITNGIITLSGGNMTTDVTNSVSLGANNVLTVAPEETNGLMLTFNSSTGTFSGKFTNPTTSKSDAFYGAVLQTQNQARGFFLDTNQTGKVLLTGE